MIQLTAEKKNRPELSPQEIERVISQNVQRLHDFYVGNKVRLGKPGMWHGERMFGAEDRSLLIEGIKITYNAQTGEIVFPEGEYDDETFRILRTWFLTIDNSREDSHSNSNKPNFPEQKYYAVQTVYAEGDLSAEDATAAIEQSTFYEDEEGELQVDAVGVDGRHRWINPEKVLNDFDWFQFQSLFVQRSEFKPGDKTFFKSLDEFNSRYWLPAETELFEKTGKNVVVKAEKESGTNPEKPSFMQTLKSWLRGKKSIGGKH